MTASAADDAMVDPSIYRRKQTSPIGKFEQVLRRRSLKQDIDMVDTGATKRGSAPVFGANNEVFHLRRHLVTFSVI